MCGIPATAASLVPATAASSDFGVGDTAEARGFGRAAPRDTSCPVARPASTRLSVLLWPPSVTTATAVRLVPGGADRSDSPPSLPLSIRDHRAAQFLRLFRIPTISFLKPINSKTLTDLIPSSLRLLSMASAASVSRTC